MAYTTSERDIRYFNDANLWPHLVLPIKRQNERAEWGIEMACLNRNLDNSNLRIAHANLFELKDATWEPITVEQLIEEGWIVD